MAIISNFIWRRAVCFTCMVLLGAIAWPPQAAAQSVAPYSLARNAQMSESLFLQAKSYHDGHGVPQDFHTARQLYLQSAALGNINAQLNLGYMSYVGEGVPVDYTAARQWYTSAAQSGSNDALHNLAMMDALGLGQGKAPTPLPTPAQIRPIEVPKTPKEIELAGASQTKEDTTSATSEAQLDMHPVDLSVGSDLIDLMPLAGAGDDTLNTSDGLDTEFFDTAHSTLAEAEDTADAVQIASEKFARDTQSMSAFEFTPQTVAIQKKASPNIPAPSNARLEPYRMPSGLGLLIIGVLACVAALTGIWFWREMRKITNLANEKALAHQYIDENIAGLRLSYIHRHQAARTSLNPNDQWSVAVSSALVRFAMGYGGQDAKVKKKSESIRRTLAKNPALARTSLFPLVKYIQASIHQQIRVIDSFHNYTQVQKDPTHLTCVSSRDEDSQTVDRIAQDHDEDTDAVYLTSA